jgi:hypothetical protein
MPTPTPSSPASPSSTALPTPKAAPQANGTGVPAVSAGREPAIALVAALLGFLVATEHTVLRGARRGPIPCDQKGPRS